MHALDLPPTLTQRPLVLTDAAAVAQLMADQEIHDVGEAAISESDIVGDWQRPSFDLASSSVGIFDEAQLVAYGEVTTAERGDAAVHPAYRGRGIGTGIAGWMQATARDRGMRSIEMQVPQGSAGDRLLTSLGYVVSWTAWDLALDASSTPPPSRLPAGYATRAAEPREHAACWEVVEDAFLEWSDRDRIPFDDWAAGVLGRPGFEAWNLRVTVDSTGTVVGVAVVLPFEDAGYIEKLAVHGEHRGLGLGLALITHSFNDAVRRGARRLKLSTDSRTGALGLYEGVGMQVASTWLNRYKALA